MPKCHTAACPVSTMRIGKVRPGGNLRWGFRCLTVKSESFAELLHVAGGGCAGELHLLPYHAASADACSASVDADRSRVGLGFLDLSRFVWSAVLFLPLPRGTSDQRTALTPGNARHSRSLPYPIRLLRDCRRKTASFHPQTCHSGLSFRLRVAMFWPKLALLAAPKPLENACQFPANRA